MMATTALSVMRPAISKLDGTYYNFSTTTNVAASSVVLIDTKLEGIGLHEDDKLNNWWVWLNTTTNPSVERVIEDYTGAAGSITVRGANLAAESASVSGEIHQFRPSDIKDAFNHAIYKEYPFVYREIEDTTLHTHQYQTAFDVPSGIQDINTIQIETQMGYEFDGNILYLEGYSAGFEDWTASTKPDGSDAPTALTLTEYGANEDEEDFILYGTRSCKSVATASSTCSHYWTSVTSPAHFSGQTLTYEEKIYSKTASRIKVEIKDNVGSTASTTFHGGTGWEMVRATHTVTNGPTSLQAGVTVASGTAFTFYRDQAILTRAERQVTNRWGNAGNYRVYGNVIRFSQAPTANRFLRVVGRLPLSEVGADTTTIEIGEPQVQIIYRAALIYLYDQYRSQRSGQADNPYNDDYVIQGISLNQARKLYGMKQYPIRFPRMQP